MKKQVFYFIGAIFLSVFLAFLFIYQESKDVLVKLKVSEINKKLAEVPNIGPYQELLLDSRKQIGVVTEYSTEYYSNAFPPANSGACADLIWRTFKDGGIDFKKAIDEDFVKHSSRYPVEPKKDKNINFRRVRNIRIFLENYSKSLTRDIIPNDFNNLKEWQGGDIVTFEQMPGGLWHIAIVSDKRRNDGVPLIIHNYGAGVKETDYLFNWPAPISGHYRFTENNLDEYKI